ncbi:MAG: acetylglutamate kinase [Anaerosomatales bacterium]|nr:acetylglutamate kinase [Anaerosomatales bacterium]
MNEHMQTLLDKALTLTEALPWIKRTWGRTVVIKYGGSAMTDPAMRASIADDIVLMKLVGVNPVIVHGGGPDITAYMERLSMPVEFRNGLRVTPPEAMEVVKMVLVGKNNKDIVSDINSHGRYAVGISGDDGNLIRARQLDPALGMVGEVTGVDTTVVVDLISDGFIPVIATVGAGEDGASYNINADTAAGEIAAALDAEKIIFLTDVDGLYADFSDKSSLISALSLEQARAMVARGEVEKGMLPKVQACVRALEGGVSRAHILNGTTPHALLLEVYTDAGVGTMITRNGESAAAAEGGAA